MWWRYFLLWNLWFCVASAATVVLRNFHGPMNEMQLPNFGNGRQFQLNIPFSASAIKNSLGKVIDVISNQKPFTIQITKEENSSQDPDPYQKNPISFFFGRPVRPSPNGNGFRYPPRGPPQHSQGHHRHNQGHGRPRYPENYPYYYADDIGGNPYLKEYDEQNSNIEYFYREPINNHSGEEENSETPRYSDDSDYQFTTENINLDEFNQQRGNNRRQIKESNVVGYFDKFPVILLNENEIR